ncbi:unnamed protein product [Phytophthora fragariaefolia]|uniref:Unnamed protein product n=1 Tax=Phytophthora fragariaefolia TaxID=1490495 RepID=A0A9W7D638_9STRA|nr:unnamed protein product [Phytophthora fragariaefolia]
MYTPSFLQTEHFKFAPPPSPFRLASMEVRAHATQKRRKHSSTSEGSDYQDVSDDSWPEGSNCWMSRSDASIQFETLSTVSNTGSSVTHVDGSGGSLSHASGHPASLVRAVAPALEQTQFDSWESFHEYLVKYVAQSYQINASARLVHGGVEDPGFAVFITDTTLEHNHTRGSVNYEQYASVRTSLTLQVTEAVNELRKAGAKKKNIHDYILEHTDRKKCSFATYIISFASLKTETTLYSIAQND